MECAPASEALRARPASRSVRARARASTSVLASAPCLCRAVRCIPCPSVSCPESRRRPCWAPSRIATAPVLGAVALCRAMPCGTVPVHVSHGRARVRMTRAPQRRPLLMRLVFHIPDTGTRHVAAHTLRAIVRRAPCLGMACVVPGRRDGVNRGAYHRPRCVNGGRFRRHNAADI